MKCFLKILVIFFLLILFLIGKYLPPLGIKYTKDFIFDGTILKISPFSLGLAPYINAYLIFVILAPVIPKLSTCDSQKLHKMIISLAIFISMFMSLFKAISAIKFHKVKELIFPPVPYIAFSVISSILATILIIWICLRITKQLSGCGFSLIVLVELLNKIIFNIICHRKKLFLLMQKSIPLIILFISAGLLLIFITKKEIRKKYDGKIFVFQISLPGILPWYLANSIWLFPATIFGVLNINFLEKISFIYNSFYISSFILSILFFIFSLFWIALIFNFQKLKESGLSNRELKQISKILFKVSLVWSCFFISFHFTFKFLFKQMGLPMLFNMKDLILLWGVLYGLVKFLKFKNHAISFYSYPLEVFLYRSKLESEGKMTKFIHKEPYGRFLGFNIGPLSEAFIQVLPEQRTKN